MKYWYTGEMKGEKVSVCVLRPGVIFDEGELNKFIMSENLTSIKIQHPNILNFLGCTIQTNLICTIHEEIVGENLFYLNKEKLISWEVSERARLWRGGGGGARARGKKN